MWCLRELSTMVCKPSGRQHMHAAKHHVGMKQLLVVQPSRRGNEVWLRMPWQPRTLHKLSFQHSRCSH